MSFASEVKAELSQIRPKNACCRQAQLYGMLEGGHAFSGKEISLQTEHETVAGVYREQVQALLPPGREVRLETRPRRSGFYVVQVAPGDIGAVLTQFGHETDTASLRLNRANLGCDQCAAAYLRGAFLACGAVTNPETDYHLEFCLPYYNLSRDFLNLLLELGLKGKYICRKGNHVIYFKESEQIEDCLTLMGATNACLTLMNVKMVKDIRNQANRIANCENANIDKVVAAAADQREAIEKLRQSGVLSTLSEELQELAELRLQHPDASLRELGELLTKPVSRSGVNHRLQRLIELANRVE